MASSRRSGAATQTRREKVRWIFERFDVNRDGGLNRSEMADLVAAVNATLQFNPDQVSSVVDEVFRSYSDYIPDPVSGLSLAGLLQTYADGAGDLDKDFADISLHHPYAINALANPSLHPRYAPAWLSSPNHGVTRESTWKIVEDLEIAIRSKIKGFASKVSSKDMDGFSDAGWWTELGMESEKNGGFSFNEKSSEFRAFLRELKEIRAKVDGFPMVEEVFDGHLAIGRTLFERRLFSEALESFSRSSELRPLDVRPRYRMGNTLWSLGRLKEAKDSLFAALHLAEADSLQWPALLPQIHVNLGIVMESEGLVINACEHYREAAILFPSHYRALKLLGSALLGVGELEQAQKALEEAILLKPDYPEALCDLGCVFYAMKEEEKAILAFQRAIDLKPDHLDALYNLGSLFLNAARHHRAAEMFGRVVAISPDHWKAQLNRGISLFGAGEWDESKKDLSEALKLTNRIELYEAIQSLKQTRKKKKPYKMCMNWVQVDAAKFKRTDEGTTDRKSLADVLWIREIQKATKLGRCDVSLLKKEMDSHDFAASFSDGTVRKTELEILLLKLLHFLKPVAFRDVIRAFEEKIWRAMDANGSGRIHLPMFFAIVAPLCGGSPENRKRVAFDALSWQPSKHVLPPHLPRSHLQAYMKHLRNVYFPSREVTDPMEVQAGEGERTVISLVEFLELFDDRDRGFGVMGTLLKLERGERVQNSRHSCRACRCRINSIAFKEMKAGFSLCTECYIECKVPLAFEGEEEYRFKES
ncbi:hypothetical protein HPP92_006843 [Vanilla planifolia]|uniref:EF-hand domain-containing protein n=1 Tax=Vanilla planifolia TaxID=51239 RepID=A0A835V789_VANPL|nr:hypothetical protein HPP92_006843 [Vanilla planifolia]